MSVCLFAHVFLGHFEIDWDTLGTKFLLGGTRSPSGTRGRSLGRRQGRSLGRIRGRGVSRSRRRSRSRSRSRGVGERFKPIVDLIDTIKLARLHRAVAKRTKYAKCAFTVRQRRTTQQSCYLVRRRRQLYAIILLNMQSNSREATVSQICQISRVTVAKRLL